MDKSVALSVIIPIVTAEPHLASLLPQLRAALTQLEIEAEILVVTQAADPPTLAAAAEAAAQMLEPREPGYGGALLRGFAAARGDYILSMDADNSHPVAFIRDLWEKRLSSEVVIASRYVAGSRTQMPADRYLFSRLLNLVFGRGLSLPIRDMSSGFRLYQAEVVRGHPFVARDFDILQEILVRVYAEGWRVCEVPFAYAPRPRGSSQARVLQFGLAYLRTFGLLWNWRNSIMAADYDDRAYDSVIFLQRYWQRERFRHITNLLPRGEPVLDVGCGSSRILSALPAGSLGVDILLRKLRYARRFSFRLVQGSGFHLPFANGAFPCVLCSQVIEHVPKTSPILDELVRVLKPGGCLVLGTPDYGHWQWVWMEKFYGWFAPGGYADEHIAHYTCPELVEHFEKRNFTLEATRYILGGELILAFTKPAPDSGGAG